MHIDTESGIAVIGYGSWATALVHILTLNGHHVNWYIRNSDILESVQEDGFNCKYLSDVELVKDNITASDDLNGIVSRCGILFMVTPAAYLKTFLEPLRTSLEGKFIISAIKGTVPGEDATVSEFFHNDYGIPCSHLGVICGPTHAEEVSHGRMTYISAACAEKDDAEKISGLLSCRHLKVSISGDVPGTEYAAILKNVYAIAAGLASGLGYGDNFLAVLVASSSAEMRKVLSAVNHKSADIPAGSTVNALGDLLVTCYSNYSRNRRLGVLIGRGCTVKSALNEMTMVAEGYFAANGIKHIVERLGVDAPIADMVYNVLYNKFNPRKEMKRLESVL